MGKDVSCLRELIDGVDSPDFFDGFRLQRGDSPLLIPEIPEDIRQIILVLRIVWLDPVKAVEEFLFVKHIDARVDFSYSPLVL